MTINKRILEVAWQCWDQNIALGDLPSHTDFELPPEPVPPPYYSKNIDKKSAEYELIRLENEKYRDAWNKFRRIRQRNMDLTSLRCSAVLKLDQAQKFKDFEEIFFPYVSARFDGRYRVEDTA